MINRTEKTQSYGNSGLKFKCVWDLLGLFVSYQSIHLWLHWIESWLLWHLVLRMFNNYPFVLRYPRELGDKWILRWSCISISNADYKTTTMQCSYINRTNDNYGVLLITQQRTETDNTSHTPTHPHTHTHTRARAHAWHTHWVLNVLNPNSELRTKNYWTGNKLRNANEKHFGFRWKLCGNSWDTAGKYSKT